MRIFAKHTGAAAVAACTVFFLASCGAKKSDTVNVVKKDVKSFSVRGAVLFHEGKYDDAARLFDRARLAAMGIDYCDGIAEALNNLGQVYLVAGDLAGAREKFQAALDKQGECPDGKKGVTYRHNLGEVARLDKNFGESGAMLEEARENAAILGERVLEARVINSQGLLLMDEGDIEGAQKKFETALAAARHFKRHKLAASCLQNLGLLYERKGMLDTARTYYEDALREDKLIEYSIGIRGDLEKIGATFMAEGDYPSAENYFERALTVNLQLGFKAKALSNLSLLKKAALAQNNGAAAAKYEKMIREIEEKR